MESRVIKTLCVSAVVVGLLNFLAFGIIATCLGGDAVNGRTENGRYFLSSHGKDIEVSRAVFNYSRIHVYSVWITHPLALLSGIILGSMDRGKKNQPSI
jgi:hypothetical protein